VANHPPTLAGCGAGKWRPSSRRGLAAGPPVTDLDRVFTPTVNGDAPHDGGCLVTVVRPWAPLRGRPVLSGLVGRDGVRVQGVQPVARQASWHVGRGPGVAWTVTGLGKPHRSFFLPPWVVCRHGRHYKRWHTTRHVPPERVRDGSLHLGPATARRHAILAVAGEAHVARGSAAAGATHQALGGQGREGPTAAAGASAPLPSPRCGPTGSRRSVPARDPTAAARRRPWGASPGCACKQQPLHSPRARGGPAAPPPWTDGAVKPGSAARTAPSTVGA